MAVIRSLLVKITGDTSGLQKSLGDAQGRMRSALGGMQGMGRGFASGMGGSFNMAGLKIAAGIGIAVMAIQRFVGSIRNLAAETMPMYAEQQEAIAKLMGVSLPEAQPGRPTQEADQISMISVSGQPGPSASDATAPSTGS